MLILTTASIPKRQGLKTCYLMGMESVIGWYILDSAVVHYSFGGWRLPRLSSRVVALDGDRSTNGFALHARRPSRPFGLPLLLRALRFVVRTHPHHQCASQPPVFGDRCHPTNDDDAIAEEEELCFALVVECVTYD